MKYRKLDGDENKQKSYSYEPGDLETVVTDHGLDVAFRIKVIADLLECPLCKGFFRNATTIKECLHTFCNVCIINYIESGKESCPKCGEYMGVYPTEGLVFDRTIQNITDKIFPQFRILENQLKKEFNIKYNIDNNNNNNNIDILNPNLYSKICRSSIYNPKLTPINANNEFYNKILDLILNSDDKDKLEEMKLSLNISIRLFIEPIDKTLPNLIKPYILVAPQITIQHLQNYLLYKFPDISEIPQILLEGVVLPKNHSIEFICRSKRIELCNIINLKYRFN
ncbi:zinc C3HC4 type domain-containing protein [Cryptosporidium andersoni]|uniref:Zinc C3HC4 type domain-containing protein n=1 Tax=Cryptosporidium andersoni TaxID=117008 RepID=A0A1J4MDL5_9CRYT|nr:zinc C3HC4 type domain-containing protein [Cryptosporidium andersoni]